MNYNEKYLLIETVKIIVRRFNKEEFSTEDFICKITDEDYKPSRYGNYNSQWGGFLSAYQKELSIEKVRKDGVTPMVWQEITV